MENSNTLPLPAEVQRRIDLLEQWKREVTLILDPILEYGQKHSEIKLGSSITSFVLERCKQYDQLKAENAALQKQHEQLKARVEKYEKVLKDIAKQHKSSEWEQEGDTQYAYDYIINLARKTLPGKEGEKEGQP